MNVLEATLIRLSLRDYPPCKTRETALIKGLENSLGQPEVSS